MIGLQAPDRSSRSSQRAVGASRVEVASGCLDPLLSLLSSCKIAVPPVGFGGARVGGKALLQRGAASLSLFPRHSLEGYIESGRCPRDLACTTQEPQPESSCLIQF